MPTVDELKAQVAEEIEKKKLSDMLNDLKGVAQTTQKIEIPNTPKKEQTVTKLQAAIEVKNNVKIDKILHFGSMVALLIVYGITQINGLFGGIAAILFIAAIAYRAVMIVKLEKYLKQEYDI